MILNLIFTPISAIFYRAGGMDKLPTTQPTWIPIWLRHSWVRDKIIPLLSIVILWKQPTWIHLIFYPM